MEDASRYSSLEDILREASALRMHEGEDVGQANGTNTVFYTSNDILSLVRVYAVASNNQRTVFEATKDDTEPNKINLNAAPAAPQRVLVDYEQATVREEVIEGFRDDAVAWLKRCFEGVFDYQAKWGDNIPNDAKAAVRLYAAGLLLEQELGLNKSQGLQEESDDKMKKAYRMIKKILKTVQALDGKLRTGSVVRQEKPFLSEAYPSEDGGDVRL